MSITKALIAKTFLSTRVNIYFGLQAYNAPYPVIIAYLVYIAALIVSVSVYHFRWHREGRTMRGERRIQVQDFLMGQDGKKSEKRDSLTQPLLSLVSKRRDGLFRKIRGPICVLTFVVPMLMTN